MPDLSDEEMGEEAVRLVEDSHSRRAMSEQDELGKLPGHAVAEEIRRAREDVQARLWPEGEVKAVGAA